MGWEVHARRDETKPDGITCRVWSTVVDQYITDDLSLDEARSFFLNGNLEVAKQNAAIRGESVTPAVLRDALRSFEEFWQEAELNLLANGASHCYYGGNPGDGEGLNAPWRS